MSKSKKNKHHFFIIGSVIIFILIIGIIFLLKIKPISNLKRKTSIDSSKNNNGVVQIFDKNQIDFIDPNNYKDEQGKIKKINTNITPSEDKQYKYANTTNNFKTYFSKKDQKSNSDIKIQRDNASITFSILNRLIISDIDKNGNEFLKKDLNQSDFNFENNKTYASDNDQRNQIKYSNVYQQDNISINIIYTVENNRLLEEIILDKFIGFPQFSQTLKLENVYAQKQNNRINFYSQSSHKIIWFIPQPKMYEQSDQQNVNTDIRYEIDCSDPNQKLESCSQLILTKVINENGKKWLSDPKRKYPVVIDPAFQIDSGDTSANWVSSDSTNFTVSQETTIKHEGAGSIKITSASPTICWGISGSCEANCTASSYTSTTAYTDCNSSVCTGTNCWGTTPGSCDAGCAYASYSSATAYTSCYAGSSCH